MEHYTLLRGRDDVPFFYMRNMRPHLKVWMCIFIQLRGEIVKPKDFGSALFRCRIPASKQIPDHTVAVLLRS